MAHPILHAEAVREAHVQQLLRLHVGQFLQGLHGNASCYLADAHPSGMDLGANRKEELLRCQRSGGELQVGMDAAILSFTPHVPKQAQASAKSIMRRAVASSRYRPCLSDALNHSPRLNLRAQHTPRKTKKHQLAQQLPLQVHGLLTGQAAGQV